MAKKRISLLNIAAIAGAAGAAYYFYKKSKKPSAEEAAASMQAGIDKMKAAQAADDALKKQQNATETTTAAANDINNPNSFKGKVAIIQRILGVGIDGKPGQQTNTAYQKRFGLIKGPIDTYNLDYYFRIATTIKDPFFTYG
jgi:hypothetical protein